MRAPLRVIDINNFFSSTGGGVRRYHLEKLQALSDDPGLEYHVVVPSDRDEVEHYGRATIHHLPATNALGSGYRFLLNPLRLRKLFLRLQPDVIEVGSPYVLPDLVRWAARDLDCRIVGFGTHTTRLHTLVGPSLAARHDWAKQPNGWAGGGRNEHTGASTPPSLQPLVWAKRCKRKAFKM